MYTAAYLSGRCANGAQRDTGRLYHAVLDTFNPWGKALCGAKPGKRSGCGFVQQPEQQITCPRCLKKLTSIQKEKK